MTASVVSNRPATDAAFWRAERTTFVGSITPARTKSSCSAAHLSSFTEDTLRGGNPVCRRAQTRAPGVLYDAQKESVRKPLRRHLVRGSAAHQ